MEDIDDPQAGPRGLTLGFIGGLISWGLIAAAVITLRRTIGH